MDGHGERQGKGKLARPIASTRPCLHPSTPTGTKPRAKTFPRASHPVLTPHAYVHSRTTHTTPGPRTMGQARRPTTTPLRALLGLLLLLACLVGRSTGSSTPEDSTSTTSEPKALISVRKVSPPPVQGPCVSPLVEQNLERRSTHTPLPCPAWRRPILWGAQDHSAV